MLNVAYESLGYDTSSWAAGGKTGYHSAALDASAGYLNDIDLFYAPKITGPLNTSYRHCEISATNLESRRIRRFVIDVKTMLGKFGP